MEQAIGIDIGVTNVKSAIVSAEGDVLHREMAPTEADKNDWPSRVRDHVALLVRTHGQPDALGIAAPGLADPRGRCITWMQGRLEEVQGLKWAGFLGLGMDVPVLNDAQAALLAEAWIGAAAGARNAILLTLGTGVGGAILCDGRLLRGQIGRAGHLGHISLDPDGPPDITRTPGSLELSIGNYSIAHRSEGRFESTHAMIEAYRAGDPAAVAVWMKSIRALGAAVASLINIVDPEFVILGGGIAAAGDGLTGPLERELDRFEWRPNGHRAKIVLARLGEYAGAIGAARNAMLQREETEN